MPFLLTEMPVLNAGRLCDFSRRGRYDTAFRYLRYQSLLHNFRRDFLPFYLGTWSGSRPGLTTDERQVAATREGNAGAQSPDW